MVDKRRKRATPAVALIAYFLVTLCVGGAFCTFSTRRCLAHRVGCLTSTPSPWLATSATLLGPELTRPSPTSPASASSTAAARTTAADGRSGALSTGRAGRLGPLRKGAPLERTLLTGTGWLESLFLGHVALLCDN